MTAYRPSGFSVLGASSVLTLAALVACTTVEATGAAPSDTAPDAASPDASSAEEAAPGAARKLDAGGALALPFTCETDGIQGEPRPGVPLLEQLRVAAGLDALEERRAVEASSDAGTEGRIHAGTPCSGASDQPACETGFAKLSSGGEALRPPFDEVDFMGAYFEGRTGPPGYYLAYTKADVVGKVSNRAELRALFPTVDTPAKALLYANAAGYRVECQRADGWLRGEAGGWVLVASRGHEKRCLRTDVLLFVRPDGTTEELDVIENQPDACT
jgi:hypothetical protein